MAITIELWTNDRLIDGAEHWWDDVEATLHDLDPNHESYPLLSQIDPYRDTTFARDKLESLANELRHLNDATTRSTVLRIAEKLTALCVAGLEAPTAELRFVGD